MRYLQYLCAWALFFLGDFVSRPMCWKHGAFLHSTYQFLMAASYRMQQRSGRATPWPMTEWKK